MGNPDRSLNDYLSVYFGENVERLKAVKQKYDTTNVFQFEQGIIGITQDPTFQVSIIFSIAPGLTVWAVRFCPSGHFTYGNFHDGLKGH